LPTLNNPNNDYLNVKITGMTGSGLTACSFEIFIEVIEFDV
jgi:hypothetical protein